jgi:hypothetical protein
MDQGPAARRQRPLTSCDASIPGGVERSAVHRRRESRRVVRWFGWEITMRAAQYCPECGSELPAWSSGPVTCRFCGANVEPCWRPAVAPTAGEKRARRAHCVGIAAAVIVGLLFIPILAGVVQEIRRYHATPAPHCYRCSTGPAQHKAVYRGTGRNVELYLCSECRAKEGFPKTISSSLAYGYPGWPLLGLGMVAFGATVAAFVVARGVAARLLIRIGHG